MIRLKTDCLIFQTSDGELVPCSAEWVALELMGEGGGLIDPAILHHVSAAVLHYFKHDLRREFVSVGEFVLALEKALRAFGLTIYADTEPGRLPAAQQSVLDSNLHELARSAGKGFELLFFPHLRQELRSKLGQSPRVLRFHGLRGCVKHLAGAERWTPRCQNLNDQIVDYLRSCWQTERASHSCALVVL
jgi:hypothetical protein